MEDMNLIDTHAHLYDLKFDQDREEMVGRAKKEGVQKVLLPNIDVDTIDRLHRFVEDFPDWCYPMMGLHPCSVSKHYTEQLDQIHKQLKQREREYVAIGEIGIDLYWDSSLLKEQQHCFATQVQWAIDYQLPFAIHVRSSFNELFEVLRDFNPRELRGVFHCFGGTLKQYETIQQLGDFYVGIGGVLTYRNSKLPEVMKHVDIQRIVLETDAPYLPPVPHRGKRNEPAYLTHVLDKLVDIFGKSPEEIASITSKNASTLFGI